MREFARLQIDRIPGALRYRFEVPDHDGTTLEEIEHPVSDEALADALVEAGALLRQPEVPGFSERAVLVGQRLYRNLVPSKLREQLADLKLPILLITGLPDFPFELFHDGEEFLGIRFAVGRRVVTQREDSAGTQRQPSKGGRLEALVIGSNPRGDLSFVEAEAEAIHSCLARSLGDRANATLLIASPVAGQAAFHDITSRLAQGIDILHYCGHVERRADGTVGLLLADERLLSVDDVANNLQGTPIVFLNGCASARRSATPALRAWQEDLASLAGGFIRGGARAVIGTTSDVSDRYAAQLAEEFYQESTARVPLGEALRRARAHCRDKVPDSPAWLSFILFGNPARALIWRRDTGAIESAAGTTETIIPRGFRAFSAADADSFLALLPGPVRADGLPDSIGFWKDRIESTDPDFTFRVGLMYGPSGCGKSSLLRAGLLPRLNDRVIPVCINAAADGTENMLSRALAALNTTFSGSEPLAEMLAALRSSQGLPRQSKVLIVIDQFEQWLHSNRHDVESAELTSVLREADGLHISCLLLVRDDFWTATDRVFRAVGIPMRADSNCQLVDLFDHTHARRVLHLLGAAYGRWAADAAALTENQRAFLDEAIPSLSIDGRVVCVRISLLAQMLRDQAWIQGTLSAVGGAEGLGLMFFEEVFESRRGVFEHRVLAGAARHALRALLPARGDDIQSQPPTWDELRRASGLTDLLRFNRLLEILDNELRVITPTEVVPSRYAEPDIFGTNREASPVKRYQLTHDYLIAPLRDWLTRSERRTFSGRARLALQEYSRRWDLGGARDADLPPWRATATLLLGTAPSVASEGDRIMLRTAATDHFPLRMIASLLVYLPLMAAGLGSAVVAIVESLTQWQRSQLTGEETALVIFLSGLLALAASFPALVLCRHLLLWTWWITWQRSVPIVLSLVAGGAVVICVTVGATFLSFIVLRDIIHGPDPPAISCSNPSRTLIEMQVHAIRAMVDGSMDDSIVEQLRSLLECSDRQLAMRARLAVVCRKGGIRP